jgi:hypothetical protein
MTLRANAIAAAMRLSGRRRDSMPSPTPAVLAIVQASH